MVSSVPLKMYDEKCAELLKEPEIRFAGIVDEAGKVIAGGFKDGLEPFEGDETKLQRYLEFVSKETIQRDYDHNLGPINYLAARRDKVVLVSFPFPISKILLLVSAEPSSPIEALAEKAVGIFTGVT